MPAPQIDTGARAPVYGPGSHSQTGLSELTMLEVTCASDPRKRCLLNAWIDGVNLAQNTTIKAYYKIDGTNYREFASHYFIPASDSDGILLNFDCFIQNDFKITLTSDVSEGGVSVPYQVSFRVVET